MIRLPMGGSKHKRPAVPADEAYGVSDLANDDSVTLLSYLQQNLPQPGASIAAGARKKRKAVVASGRGEENSMALLRSRHRRTIFTPLHLGGPNHTCPYCGARFWLEERVRGQGCTASPVYNKCCRAGSIALTPYRAPPEPLLGLLTGKDPSLSKHFFDNIRRYNSMFAMTSMGVNVIDSINDGHGPYVFKISGQLCHRIGSLIPRHGARPEYCQLYIFDTDNEVRNRIAVATHSNIDFQPNEAIVASLMSMLDTHNPIVQVFRTARDRLSMQSDNLSDQSCDRYAVKLFSVPK
ncbi:uncharacterized protein LOC133899786 [Phragmites australis]|uniref:uncharacterized protein LOC133899786 n=1 Tax=Phragmites australis TaxID=29695 RepID=UPI002D791594|nr:uncharacterized protein LOC133899786 [Phragmites australis]